MTARPRFIVGLLSACCCGLLLAGQVLLSSATPTIANSKEPSSCEELRVWAEAYKGWSPTLDEMARFDRPHRGAILASSLQRFEPVSGASNFAVSKHSRS